MPGDMVTITGVVKVSSDEGKACMQNLIPPQTSVTTQTHSIPKIDQVSDESAVGELSWETYSAQQVI